MWCSHLFRQPADSQALQFDFILLAKFLVLLQDGTKDNPAIHVKRKGNDVVKKASELAVLDPEVSKALMTAGLKFLRIHHCSHLHQ